MSTTNKQQEHGDKTFLKRYKIIDEICNNTQHSHVSCSLLELALTLMKGERRVLKCLDRRTGNVVVLKCLSTPYDNYKWVQQCKGLLIASELQLKSDNFLKINNISLCSSPYLPGKSFVVAQDYMDLTLCEIKHMLNFNDKINIIYKVIKALSELEDAGIVLMNLNPNNIAVSKDLQTVKIRVPVNTTRLSTEVIDTYRYQIPYEVNTADEMVFRPIELSVHYFGCSYFEPLKVSHAMDIWSLGCIFAYLLRDGKSIFFSPNGSSFNHWNTETVVAYATREDFYSWRIRGMLARPNDLSENEALQGVMPKDKNTTKWMPLLAEMLRYNPEKRIQIKKLLHHEMFRKQFETYLSTSRKEFSAKTAKMDRIQIELPNDIQKWNRKDISLYFHSLFGVRRALTNELRKDLIVLAHNLADKTCVPLEIWLLIFTYANTNPVMYFKP